MPRSYPVVIGAQGGGVNDYSRPDLIASDESPNTLRNIRGEAESFKPRKGYTSFANEIASATVKALGSYPRNDSTEDSMVMVTDANKLYRIKPASESTWTEISLGGVLTDTTTVNFSNYGDFLFIFNGVDLPILVDDTTVSQPFTRPASLSAGQFFPKFGEVYLGSLFVAGVPTAPNVVFVSKTASSAAPEDIYDFSGTLTGYGNADELLFPDRITAIKALDTSLVIFTTNEAYIVNGYSTIGSTVTFDPQAIPGAGGAVSQDTVTVVENDIYYLTPQKEVKSLKRSLANASSVTTTALSTKVQRFMNEQVDPDLTSAFAYYDEPNKYYNLVVKNIDGLSNFYRLTADIDKIDQYGIPPFYIDDKMVFSCGLYYTSDSLQQSFLGSPVIGQIYKDQVGLSDNSANIQTFRSSKFFNGGDPTTQKNYKEVVVYGEMTDATEITITAYVDNIAVNTATITSADFDSGSSSLDSGIGTETIGTFTIGEEGEETDTEFGNMKEFVKRLTFRQKGKRLNYTVETDGINQNYRIRHLDYVYIPLSHNYSPLIEK